MKVVDLRSDTVTLPTPEMRRAMASAKVGDDVYGEDPTVNLLQEMAAERMGKQAGLFVASGTMGNLIAVLTHCQRGDEIIVGKKNHIFLDEAGGISVLGGVHSYQVPNQSDGSINLEDARSAVRFDDPHEPISRLICIENTHNGCGGVFQTPATTLRLVEFAHARGLSVHLDGARIFNAAVAQGIPVRDLSGQVDSVTFCLSKGLCAPVGSVLCGSKVFIGRALRMRKLLGGGMRQAGILAAAGIVALEKMVDRLSEDHTRALKLAEGLRQIPGIAIQEGAPATNMVFLSVNPVYARCTANEFRQKLVDRGILIGSIGEYQYRLVTHYWITDEGVEKTCEAFRDILVVQG